MKNNNNENLEVQNLETLRTVLSNILNLDLSQADRSALVALMVENDCQDLVVSIMNGSNVYSKEVQGSMYQ